MYVCSTAVFSLPVEKSALIAKLNVMTDREYAIRKRNNTDGSV